MHKFNAIASLLILTGTPIAHGGENTNLFTDSGSNAASIQETVDAFRAALGDLNAPNPGTLCEGRRQINWDAAPDAISAPNAFPGDFFNAPVFPRARGVEFTTPGSGFMLSATAASGAGVEFDNLDPAFSGQFATFSSERLFTPIGSNTTYVNFFIPGSDEPATTRAFGAVFTGVDYQGSTSIEAYDIWGNSLGIWEAPAYPVAESLSFVGISLDNPIIASVTIVSGDAPLGSAEAGSDVVVMDDFIFGEPVSVGECSADCPADLSGDGILDLADISLFVTAFTSQDPEADLDGNSILDLSDIQIFVTAYITGCP